MTAPHLDPTRKHTAVVLFDVTDSNPNGDPDGGNQPRTDPETGHGLVSDVSFKRKIRDTVPAVTEGRADADRYKIFVTAGTALNANLRLAAETVGRTTKKGPKDASNGLVKEAEQQAWLREHYYDIRMFGGVLSTGDYPAGKLTGPVQVEWARSVDPVVPTEHTITRVARTSEGDDPNTQIGAKWTLPYGLFRTTLHYSPSDGQKAGVTEDDLAVLWQTIEKMYDHTRSASRANVSTIGLIVATHAHRLGDCPPRKVNKAVTITRSGSDTPRSYDDYQIAVDLSVLPTETALWQPKSLAWTAT